MAARIEARDGLRLFRSGRWGKARNGVVNPRNGGRTVSRCGKVFRATGERRRGVQLGFVFRVFRVFRGQETRWGFEPRNTRKHTKGGVDRTSPMRGKCFARSRRERRENKKGGKLGGTRWGGPSVNSVSSVVKLPLREGD